MDSITKEKIILLIEQYFHSLPENSEYITIKRDNLNSFLSDFSEIVVSKTLDATFGVK